MGFVIEDNILIKYSGRNAAIVYIPDGVREIASEAFCFDMDTRTVIVPESVEKIEAFAFCYSDIACVVINGKTTKIEEGAFADCNNLHEIIISEENENYKVVDGVLLSMDMTVLQCCPACKKGRYVMPDTVKEIAMGAFSKCFGLTEVVVNEGVTQIDKYTFHGTGDMKIYLPKSVKRIGNFILP